MTPEVFNEILTDRITVIKALTASKGQEYAKGKADRLHNFKVAATMNETTPEQALWGMLTKHLVSVMDMIKATSMGETPTRAKIDEKIGDCIIYFILLEAILKERLPNEAV